MCVKICRNIPGEKSAEDINKELKKEELKKEEKAPDEKIEKDAKSEVKKEEKGNVVAKQSQDSEKLEDPEKNNGEAEHPGELENTEKKEEKKKQKDPEPTKPVEKKDFIPFVRLVLLFAGIAMVMSGLMSLSSAKLEHVEGLKKLTCSNYTETVWFVERNDTGCQDLNLCPPETLNFFGRDTQPEDLFFLNRGNMLPILICCFLWLIILYSDSDNVVKIAIVKIAKALRYLKEKIEEFGEKDQNKEQKEEKKNNAPGAVNNIANDTKVGEAILKFFLRIAIIGTASLSLYCQNITIKRGCLVGASISFNQSFLSAVAMLKLINYPIFVVLFGFTAALNSLVTGFRSSNDTIDKFISSNYIKMAYYFAQLMVVILITGIANFWIYLCVGPLQFNDMSFHISSFLFFMASVSSLMSYLFTSKSINKSLLNIDHPQWLGRFGTRQIP